MYYVFNIIIIALVGLIAYWWANQGLFSALLHLICVIVAGAIALAVWEPLALAALVKGSSGFSNYGWGITLVISFALLLFIFRLVMDKLAPRNVHLPAWVNLVFGLPVGAFAGIITLGIFVLGAGFIQSSDSLFNFKGWSRDRRNGEIRSVNALWVPVNQITSEFYDWLSVTSMSTSRPLRHYNPELYKQATLIRDSYRNKKVVGALAMSPDSVRVGWAIFCPDNNRHAVKLHFDASARDFDDQLTLSRSQIRLISAARGMAKPGVSYPDRWTQDIAPGEASSGVGHYTFENDITAYICNVPGRESADVTVQFPPLSGGAAAFIQIRNIRLPVNARSVDITEWNSTAGTITDFDRFADVSDTGSFTPRNIQYALNITNQIRSLNVGTNRLPGSIHVNADRYLTSGQASFSDSGERAASALAVQGIYEPAGTKVVLLDISPSSPASVFGAAARLTGEGDRLALIDIDGRPYSALGYIHRTGSSTDILLSPGRFLQTINDVPPLPRVGDQTIHLVFRITEGVTITSFRWGDLTIGNCNLPIR